MYAKLKGVQQVRDKGSASIGYRGYTSCSTKDSTSNGLDPLLSTDVYEETSDTISGYKLFSKGPFLTKAKVTPSASERYPGLQDFSVPTFQKLVNNVNDRASRDYRDFQATLRDVYGRVTATEGRSQELDQYVEVLKHNADIANVQELLEA